MVVILSSYVFLFFTENVNMKHCYARITRKEYISLMSHAKSVFILARSVTTKESQNIRNTAFCLLRIFEDNIETSRSKLSIFCI